MTETFKANPAGLPGNDDLGATSAWYIWGAIGLYPAIPGVGGFVISSPSFRSVRIRLGDGRQIHIISGGSRGGPYVRGLTLNRKSYPRTWLPVRAVGSGTTTLRFTLADEPDTSWPGSRAGAPPSFTQGQAPAIGFIYGEDSVAVRQGDAVTFSLGVQEVVDGPLSLKWSAAVPGELQLRPSSGALRIDDGRRPKVDLELIAPANVPPGIYTIPIRLQVVSPGKSAVTLPETVLEVRVTAAGSRD
jgi:hypothetical protein